MSECTTAVVRCEDGGGEATQHFSGTQRKKRDTSAAFFPPKKSEFVGVTAKFPMREAARIFCWGPRHSDTENNFSSWLGGFIRNHKAQ